MNGYLLDTNVISELTKKRPSLALRDRLQAVPAERLATSAICVAELRFGTARHPAGEVLWERMRREILSLIRILPLGEAEAVRAGDILAGLEARGANIGLEDVLIGATALERDLIAVTRNVEHLARIPGLTVQCWWD